jgi:threonine/homoserine efflux transporter RhtA
MKLSAHTKAIVAALSPVILAVQAAVTDGQITLTEWGAIGVAVAAAVGVWLAPNRSRARR